MGTYNILNGGQKLSTTSENRIKAINIAREWVEAVENIRDTNWIKFSSDYNNCWHVKDYNVWCVGTGNGTFPAGSYILTQSGTLWTLSGTIIPLSYDVGYRSQFPIFLDVDGLTRSYGNNINCTPLKTSDCKTIFTREIIISYPSLDHMKVNSIVKWMDGSKTSGEHIINLETILTNWKKQF
jgi:hypothetical protein